MRNYAIAALAALAGVGACRGTYVTLWVTVAGQSLTSPSMRYRASAMFYERQRFFGGQERWSRLSVIDGLERTIWETTVMNDLDMAWRDRGTVIWAADSSSVVFEVAQSNGAHVRLLSATFPAAPSMEEIGEELGQDVEHRP